MIADEERQTVPAEGRIWLWGTPRTG